MLQISELVKTYGSFIQPYRNAMALVKVWLENLKREFEDKYRHNPIHSISNRIKTLSSIAEKLDRRHIKPTFENARNHLTDIAGLRVTCYYIQDVYAVADAMKKQHGTILIKETDYIKNPKPNGYRTYQMVIGVALYNAGEYYPVEIQVRTLAMDFWASMEHQLVYKHDGENKEEMSAQLKEYADDLFDMEVRLSKLYDGAPVEKAERTDGI
ncbi:MAG: (p)ppGpp synthetase [Lachnospiraceae bacterium]|nr:(p)ppGpp synthetase [Lachnospiraceae bacterium]